MKPELRAEDAAANMDQRVVLQHVSWSQYKTAMAMRGQGSGTRIAYLDGLLELMTPSITHEEIKKTIARLLEAYADEKEIDLIGLGSWTLKRSQKRAGVEPDECYWVGKRKPVPDLAIEVIHTSGGLDKLEIYRRLGVREVWVWQGGSIGIHVLSRGAYTRRKRSAVLPDLDLEFLTSFVLTPNQARAVRAYRAALRSIAH